MPWRLVPEQFHLELMPLLFGSSAFSNGINATAIGSNANASHANSIALGADSLTSRDDQLMLGVAATQVTVANLANSSQERNAIVIANEDGTLSRYEVGESTLTSSDCDALEAKPYVTAHNQTPMAMEISQHNCYWICSPSPKNYGTALGYYANASGCKINCVGCQCQCHWEVGHRHRP